MKTFSINGAAELLERDRRTVTKAMRYVKPDSFVHGSPRWRLPTILNAMEGTNDHGLGGQLIDKIETNFEALDAGFARFRAEPDLAHRRLLDKQLGIGRLIGDLDRQMTQANAATGEDQGLSSIVGDQLIGDLISRYLSLVELANGSRKIALLGC
jgi:hypothetical protein